MLDEPDAIVSAPLVLPSAELTHTPPLLPPDALLPPPLVTVTEPHPALLPVPACTATAPASTTKLDDALIDMLCASTDTSPPAPAAAACLLTTSASAPAAAALTGRASRV